MFGVAVVAVRVAVTKSSAEVSLRATRHAMGGDERGWLMFGAIMGKKREPAEPVTAWISEVRGRVNAE
jgi:hypothetical protein